MIHRKIEKDLQEEFVKLNDGLKIHLVSDFDIDEKKEFLKTHLPKEIVCLSELLLDTLLNDLMGEARKNLEKADITLQNQFFEADFRKRIKKWVSQLDNELKLDPDIVKYSTDPRLKQALIAGGITFVIGSVVTVSIFIPTMAVGAIVAGLVTILLSALAFKVAYNKAAPKSRETMKDDIDRYLKEAEGQVQIWLNSIIEAFSKDFDVFCTSNGFNPGDK